MNTIPHYVPSQLAALSVEKVREVEAQLARDAAEVRARWLQASEDLGRLAEELSEVRKHLGPRVLQPIAAA